MTKDQKQQIKNKFPEYLISLGIPLKENFRCINPEHSDETPSMSYDAKRNKLHCFGCGADYDIYDVLRIQEGLLSDKEVFKFAEEFFLKGKKSESDFSMLQRVPIVSRETKKEYVYQTGPLTEEGITYLKNRGISKDTANKFNLQFINNLKMKDFGPYNCIAVPTGDNSYTFRNISDTAPEKDKIRKGNSSLLFNKKVLEEKDPVFVVEGEFDVLSISEVGYSAIGLGSTSNYHKFISEIKTYDSLPLLILSLDNDSEGIKFQELIKKELSELKIPFIEYNIAGSFKDANEALVKDKYTFIESLQKAVCEKLEDSSSAKGDYFVNTSLAVLSELRSERSISTGFNKLDEILDGGLYNELYVLGGSSSIGKTSFMLQIADQIAQTKDVLFFSLEVSKKVIVSKSLSRIICQNSLKKNSFDERYQLTSRMITGTIDLTTTQKENLSFAHKTYRDTIANHFFLFDDISYDVYSLQEAITNHINQTGNIPVVFIDYLQILEADGKTDKQNIDKIIKELKRLTKVYALPIVIISSFSRAGYNEEASMESFKDSGSIEYSSDVLLGLQFSDISKKDFKQNEAKKKSVRSVSLSILKNRNGYTGAKINFDYRAAYNLFIEK